MADETTNHDGDAENELTDADKSKEKKHDSGAADLVSLTYLSPSSNFLPHQIASNLANFGFI